MNKIKIGFIALISAILMVLPSNAKEIRIGVAAGLTNVDASGTETMKDSAKKNKGSSDDDTVIPSLFVEIANDSGFGLGLEIVPGTADIGSKSRADDDEETASGNKASAEIDGLTSIYAIKTFDSGFFVKAGMTQTDVITKETLNTGTSYGNQTVDGVLLGIGFHKTRDNGIFFRASAEFTDYEEVTLIGSEAGADTASFNRISADVDTTAIKFSVGKAF
jgi:hypothetical protein